MNQFDEKYIELLIARGENQHLDFKYNISDSRKIAKSLVAFANTEGGKLLIGVRDNGSIAGINSEEEIFMIEAAAEMYSRPSIQLELDEWKIEKKIILEVTINESDNKPHYAENDKGKWLAYLRYHDKNILVNRILIDFWKRSKGEKGVFVRYKHEESILMKYLSENAAITQSKFSSLAAINYRKAGSIICNLLLLDILECNISDEEFYYSLK